ncbi:MAG: chemotaxis-specific protein-glutamate methyltransferase CheB [Planctomycetota bacterium]
MSFRIAIVNDLGMAREALRRLVLQAPGATVAWTANDGAEALERAKADRPDLVLMDLIMPVMDGVECTRRVMEEAPCPILVVTATVEGNASRVYEAIGAGALDAVDTPRLGSGGAVGDKSFLEMIERIRRMRRVDTAPVPASPAAARPAAATRSIAPGRCPVLAVGASTGGPQALATLLRDTPADAPYATWIVQHMEASFLPGLAQWLSTQCGRSVELARRGDRARPGSVLVAGEAQQLVVRADGTLDYEPGDPELVHRPSVDVLFGSLAAAPACTGAAVLLTGMGADGARGMLALRERGWRTFAQDRASSIVWGMPGAADQLGAAEHVLPLRALGAAVNAAMEGARP